MLLRKYGSSQRPDGIYAYATPNITQRYRDPVDSVIIHIPSTETQPLRPVEKAFDQIRVDTGTRISVRSCRKDEDYFNQQGIVMVLHKSAARFRFGDSIAPSMGKMLVCVPKPFEASNL